MAKTLELYNALKDKLGEEGTRVIIEAFDETTERGHINLATKEDIGKVKEDIGKVKEDIGKVKEDIGKVKEDIVKVKEDIGKVKEDIVKLDAKIDKVELSLRAEIEKSKSETLRWMFIFWASQIGIIIALIKLFP